MTTKTRNIGDIGKDGRVYVGAYVGPDGKENNVFAALPKGFLALSWAEAASQAKKQGAHLGSDEELNLFQKNIALDIIENEAAPEAQRKTLRAMFLEAMDSGSNPALWVWGAEKNPDSPDFQARIHSLKGGTQLFDWEKHHHGALLFTTETGALTR